MKSKEEKKAEERKRQYEAEHEEFKEWRDTVLLIDREEISNLLLFTIDKSLKKIARELISPIERFAK